MPTYKITTIIPGNTPAIDEPAKRERIVEATNQAQAIKHVVGDTITCEVCEVADAMRLAAAGVKLEKAAAE
jgi:hypothetical protein